MLNSATIVRVGWQSPKSIWRLRLNGTVRYLIGARNCEFAVCGSKLFGYVCSQALVSSRNPSVTLVADANHVGRVDLVVIDLAFEGTRVARRHHRFKRSWPGELGAIFTAGFLVCIFILDDILLLWADAIFNISVKGGSACTAHAGQPVNWGDLLARASDTIRGT